MKFPVAVQVYSVREDAAADFRGTLEKIKAMGYDGKTLLTFAVSTEKAMKDTYGYCTFVYMDNISYCEMLDTPVVTIDGTTANWTAVEGAENYTVSVNGVETTTTETSFDLSALTENAYISVRANSATEGVYSSVFSQEVYCKLSSSLKIVTFDSVSDLDYIVAGNVNDTSSWFNSAISNKAFDNSGTNGCAYLELKENANSNVGSKAHIFTVNLPSALDLSNKAGITVEFCVTDFFEDSTGTRADEVRFMVGDKIPDGDNVYYTYRKGGATGYMVATPDMTKTSFQTLTLTVEQLQTLGYGTGDTAITFVVWTNLSTNRGGGGSLWVCLDDISYYVE